MIIFISAMGAAVGTEKENKKIFVPNTEPISSKQLEDLLNMKTPFFKEDKDEDLLG